MEDGGHVNEAGVARTRIEGTRKRMSRGESLASIQREQISHMDNGITGALIAVFLICLLIIFLFGIRSLIILGILLVVSCILLLKMVSNLREKMRLTKKRREDMKSYE